MPDPAPPPILTAAPPADACGACCTRLLRFGVRLGGRTILDNINLHMHCGELTALVGPNGAGKTTLLRAMLGETPHTGELRFFPYDGSKRVPRIGYVPQKVDLDPHAPITVLDLFAASCSRRPLWLGVSHRLRAAATAALGEVEAAPLLDRHLGQLSGGQLQRVFLALALTPLPDLLLLDEPVSGFDAAGIGLFYDIISRLRRRHDLAILLISHDLPAVAAVCDRMVLLNHTILFDGPARDALTHPVVMRALGFDPQAPAVPPVHPPWAVHPVIVPAANNGETGT